jgi:hypothetical protein
VLLTQILNAFEHSDASRLRDDITDHENFHSEELADEHKKTANPGSSIV